MFSFLVYWIWPAWCAFISDRDGVWISMILISIDFYDFSVFSLALVSRRIEKIHQTLKIS